MRNFFKTVEKSYQKITRHRRMTNAVILTAFAGSFILLSYITPYVYDDIAYHYCYAGGKSFFDIRPGITPHISSWHDIFLSVKNSYLAWSGRAIAMFTVYAVFFGGKILFDLLNGIMAAAVVWMICRHICGRKAVTPSLLLTVCSLFFLCAPSPGLTLFWANGAIIYMWTALFYLLLLYPYRNFLEYGDEKISGLKMFLMIPAGIIGCTANENAAITIVTVIALVIIFTARKKREIPGWMFCGLAGAVTGCVILLGAPGVSGRIAYEGYHGVPFFSNILTQTVHLFHTIPGIFAALILMLAFNCRRIKADQWQLMIFYLLLILGSTYSMAFSPYAPGRAVFCTFIFLLCAAGKIFSDQEIRLPVRHIIAGTTAMFCLTEAAFALRDISFTNQICNRRFAAMQTAQNNGESKAWIFRPTCGLSRYNALYKTDILREDAGHFLNQHYALKYAQKSILLTPVPAVQGMETDIFPGEK